MVSVDVPTAAAPVATSERTLLLVAGLGLNEAVTPLGIPVAVSVTPPVNPPLSVTVMVSVTPELRARVNDGEDGAIVKLPPPEEPVTVSMIVVDALMDPDVHETVMLDEPAVAVLPIVNWSVVLGLNGLAPQAAVTPDGRAERVQVTLPSEPADGLLFVTVMVSVTLEPGVADSVVGEAETVMLFCVPSTVIVKAWVLAQPLALV
jgi:hypothetical protein